MRNVFTLLIGMFLLSSVNGQYKIEVKETNHSLSAGNKNCLIVTVYENSLKDVEKAWKSQLKKWGGNYSSKKGEFVLDDASDKRMGENTFDVYSLVKEAGDGKIEVIVGIDLGGAFMSSSAHSEKFNYVKSVLNEFGIKTTKDGIGNQLKSEQKVLDKQKDELSNLVKDKEGLEKDIENYKQKIKDAEAAIEQNVKDQATKDSEIKVQEKVVQEIAEKEKAVK